MLILFHYIGLMLCQMIRGRSRLKDNKGDCDDRAELSKTKFFELDPGDHENDLKFDPPVFKQRYAKVYEILIEEKFRNNLKKLVDFGCAEFGLFLFLKNLTLSQIMFVDIDEELLKEKLFRIEPLFVDLLKRRYAPLELSVFAGSAVDPDYRLKGTDVVTAVEIIEHLYPDTLDAFPYNVFSFIKPKIVVVTTPNGDFNVIFNRLHGFRHYDHKFEWTRKQFEDWAQNIAIRFPDYTVEFSGIGPGPPVSEALGCCSQMALFQHKSIFCENFIPFDTTVRCICDLNSVCRGATLNGKLECPCLCVQCQPDLSLGVCTYNSCSNKDPDSKHVEYNPGLNVFYKLVQKIEYPYEVDDRTENQRLLDTLSYRIRTFCSVNSRFYVLENDRCEIPVCDIMYGEIEMTESEICNILKNSGYEVEKCTIQETGLSENCIVCLPREMDNVTSTSEGSSYSPSDFGSTNKSDANAEDPILSDWDDIVSLKKDTKKKEIFEDRSAQESQHSDCSENDNKPLNDSLFDSGYQKSPSPQEESSPDQNSDDPEETDQFDDETSTPSLNSDDNKLHLKKAAREKFPGPLGGVPTATDVGRFKIDPNRINELDRIHNTKTFMNNFLKPQNEFKKSPLKDLKDLSAAGPSNAAKKKRIKVRKLNEEEGGPMDDARSITNTIIQNSLNKIDVGEEKAGGHEIIQNIAAFHNPESNIPRRQILEPIIEPIEQLERPDFQEDVVNLLDIRDIVDGANEANGVVNVENGDLANNNRDNEGNNFQPDDVPEIQPDEGIDIINDNIENNFEHFEELIPLLDADIANNANVDRVGDVEHERIMVDNNNDIDNFIPHLEVVDDDGQNVIEAEIPPRQENALEIAQASREALFDPNSEEDLLTDFDMPPQASDSPTTIRLITLRQLESPIRGLNRDPEPPAASIQTNTGSFPNWLLQILGTHIMQEEVPTTLGPTEPHFYCQGDGIGVHPSVIAVEIDEEDDADDETNTTSSNNTADFAEVENGPSDENVTLPEDGSSLAIDDATPHRDSIEINTHMPVMAKFSDDNCAQGNH